jgi:hypothetical protein
VDISASEVPTEALPGVGAGYGTQERRQNTKRRSGAQSTVAVKGKSLGRGGKPRAWMSNGRSANGE